MKRWILEKRDIGKEGFGTEGIQESGLDGYRKRGIQEKRDM